MYNLGLNYLLNNLKISCLKKQGLYNITIRIINYSPLPSAVFSARFAFVCLKLKWCRIYKRVHVNTIKYYICKHLNDNLLFLYYNHEKKVHKSQTLNTSILPYKISWIQELPEGEAPDPCLQLAPPITPNPGSTHEF